MEYIHSNGFVMGVSAGSLIFANNLRGNLGLIDTRLEVHCAEGEKRGKLCTPLKKQVRLTIAVAQLPCPITAQTDLSLNLCSIMSCFIICQPFPAPVSQAKVRFYIVQAVETGEICLHLLKNQTNF